MRVMIEWWQGSYTRGVYGNLPFRQHRIYRRIL